MSFQNDTPAKPPILVSDTDHRRLLGLADVTKLRARDVAEELEAEMERAEIVNAGLVPPNVIQMGSTVRYRTEDGHEREVTLVYPRDAEIEKGRISVLTPIGAALIGLSIGQTMTWRTRDGRVHALTVVDVTPPVDTELRN